MGGCSLAAQTAFFSSARVKKRVWAARLGWVGGKPKAGNTIRSTSEANSSIVSSVEHRNYHSQPGRRRQSLAAV